MLRPLNQLKIFERKLLKEITELNGSCLCGEVKFEIEGKLESFYLCHCGWCQKDTGSAHSANLFFSKAHLRWITGKERVTNYQLPETEHYKSFCSICGSVLPNLQMNGKVVVVPAGCIRNVPIEPTAHIFISKRANWDNGLEKIKMYDEVPE